MFYDTKVILQTGLCTKWLVTGHISGVMNKIPDGICDSGKVCACARALHHVLALSNISGPGAPTKVYNALQIVNIGREQLKNITNEILIETGWKAHPSGLKHCLI